MGTFVFLAALIGGILAAWLMGHGSVLIMLGLISVLIIAHEMGHYFVARWCGVRVERFGFGLPFGPTLWSKKVGDTEFCFHALLFGGYVSFPDDSEDSDVPEDSTERFENQPIVNRAAIALAGITVNAILGWLIMVFVICNWGIPTGDIAIGKLLSPETPAAKAGLLPKDVFLSYGNNHSLVTNRFWTMKWSDFQHYIQEHAGTPIQFTIQRGTETKEITVTPDAKGTIGFQLDLVNSRQIPESSFLNASSDAASFLGFIILENFKAIGQMFTHFDPQQLGGPLRIVDVGSKMIQNDGIQDGLMFTAIISTILAVMNLLPIPALDGGHLLFLFIEAIKGGPVKREVQERVIQAGFVVLLGLMVFVLWNDVYNMFLAPKEAEQPVSEQHHETAPVAPATK